MTNLHNTAVAQGGETVDYIGAVRVFGVADKLLFEQLVKLDNQDMTMQVARFCTISRLLCAGLTDHTELCLCAAAAKELSN